MEFRMRRRLNQADIATMAPGMHLDSDGLYLQVSGPESRSWIYRYTLQGRERWHGLGSARDVTLAAARKARDKARALVRSDRIDPVAERRRERQANNANVVTFRKAAEAFIAAQAHNWRNAKHADQWAGTLKAHAYPIIGDTTVAEISRADIIRVLEPIWTRTPETARRIRGRVQAILDWCIARGDRPEGENPASRGPLVRGLPKQPKNNGHHAAMPYTEVPAFMEELRSREGVAALALEFTILTGARTNEVLGAKWDEIDRVAATWTVPVARMKAGRPHRVPLADGALSVLDRAKSHHAELLFPNPHGRPLSNMAMLKLLGRMGRGQYTTHGFRASFRTWAAEEVDFDRDVVEAALAHVVSDKTEAAYQRGTLFGKRRKLMEAWAACCMRDANVK
jgi:integrase